MPGKNEVMFNLVAGLHIDRIEEKEKVFVPAYRDVSDRETVVVVRCKGLPVYSQLCV